MKSFDFAPFDLNRPVSGTVIPLFLRGLGLSPYPSP